jgi:hypothetical protein
MWRFAIFTAIAWLACGDRVAGAYPLTVSLQIPDPVVIVSTNGMSQPFAASSVTVSTTFDTTAVTESPEGITGVTAPLVISVAGLPDVTVNVASGVSIVDLTPSDGQIRFSWTLSGPHFVQSFTAAAPQLRGFGLRTAFGPAQVSAATVGALSSGPQVLLALPDGRVVAVTAIGRATLVAVPFAGVEIPANSPAALVVLALLTALAGAVHLRRRRVA